MGAIERASSFSCSSSPRRKDNQGLLKDKVIQRASSLSSTPPSSIEKEKEKKKKKQRLSCEEGDEAQKRKLIQRTSSLCSSLKREKKKQSVSSSGIQRSSSFSSPSCPSIKKEKKDEARKSSSFKSRIREMGPICKRRKESVSEVPVKFQLEDDVDLCLDRQIKEEGKDNPDDCLWLSSGSMSSPQEFGLFMRSLDPSIDEWIISFVPKSIGGLSETPVVEEDEANNEAKEPSPSFWNMDRTGVWVSSINLDGEDSNWISSSKEWDSCSSDVGFSSSTQETSQSEWSSELLSDSMDWDIDSDDPIFWPYGKDIDWDDQGWDSFSVSPRKDTCKINFESKNKEEAAVRRRRILLVSGLSASKIIEFKRGRGSKYSKMRKRCSLFKRRIPTILENVLEEGKSPKETPKKAAKLSSSDSDMLSEMDSDDGPLFWPSDHKCAWDSTWDCFNLSPRKGTKPARSPKGSSSVRLRFRPKKKKPNNTSDLCASKSFKFKPCGHKSKAAGVRKSRKRVLVILPSKMSSWLSNKSAEFKPGSCRKRIRAVPLSSVEEFMKLVSVMGKKNNKFSETVSSSEDISIETVVGLDEFDGHEGVDPEFEGDNFSFEECMKE